MSRHKTKLKGEKLCRDTIKSSKKETYCNKTFMSRHTIRVFKLQGTKEMSRHKIFMLRQLQDNFSRTLWQHFQRLSRHNSRRRHKTMSRQKTASHDKAGEQRWQLCRDIIFQCHNKATYWANFLESTILASKHGSSFENL